jgi:predicted MFS family arabinose efflux permease
MRNYLFNGFSETPKGKKSLAAQLSFCLVIILVILFVVSSVITTAYKAILEKERGEAMLSIALSSGIGISNSIVQNGMEYPLPIYEYAKDKPYIVNIYLKAGNSFLRVYSSDKSNSSEDSSDKQIMLEGAGEEYNKTFDQQQVFLANRVDGETAYIAGVAPIIGSTGAASGIIEIMMPESAYHSTVNGFSLSWVFTLLAIATSLTIVYYQSSKLLSSVFGKPNRQLPKIIRYGLSGCESIAFFSAMACVMPPLIIASFLKTSLSPSDYPVYVVQGMISLSIMLFALGFFGFRSLRVMVFKKFTSRISLLFSIIIVFLLLLIVGVFPNPLLYILFQLPISFFLGMVFFFQREYRLYASRLGHEGFEETTVRNVQYSAQVLGAAVGAVMAGILYERFGLLPVLMISGTFLFLVAIQSMLFVQHCPASNEPDLHLTSYLYALLNRKSGTFLWSTVLTLGMQLAFFIGFIPNFLESVGISLATVSFYYFIFALFCCIITKLLTTLIQVKMKMKTIILFSALLQTAGLLLFVLFPTAKILVITVAFFGISVGLPDFKYLEHYGNLIREDKRSMARIIFERAFANGVAIGSIGLGFAFMFNNIMIPLLIYSLVLAALLFGYPVMNLIYVSSSPKQEEVMRGDPFIEPDNEWQQELTEYEQESNDVFYRDNGKGEPWTSDTDDGYDPIDLENPQDGFESSSTDGGKWV